ncbi:hypothetical protein ACFX2F_019333 [Malus domestica]
MQIMTTGATSIKEQLAQISEAIVKLTRTVKENDLQIAALVNRLEAQHNEKSDPKVNPLKKETDEKEELLIDKTDEKPEVDQATMLMGSFSIQQLQEMIISMSKAQYEGSSHDFVLYSKLYYKRIDVLRMPRGYQPPKFMQLVGKRNPK